MSRKGGQFQKKHGGAHNITHGTTVFLNGGVLSSEIDGKAVFFGIESLGEEVDGIQDGGHNECMVKDEHVLGELLASGSSLETHDLSGIQRAQENVVTLTGQSLVNAEWIKSRLNTIPGVCVVGNGVVTEREDDLQDGKDVGGLFGFAPDNTDGVGLPNDAAGTSPTEDVHGFVGQHEPISALSHHLKTKVGTNRRKSQDLNVVNLSSTLMEVDQHGGQHLSHVTLSDNEGKEGLSAAERACLEELEKGSQLSPEEKELLENSRKEFQALEFHSLHSDKSNTLMTPQELELMPERGREFEESVGPKEDLARPMTPVILGKLNKRDNQMTQIVQVQPQVKNLSRAQSKSLNTQLGLSQPVNIANVASLDGNINGNILTINNHIDPETIAIAPVLNEVQTGAFLQSINQSQTVYTTNTQSTTDSSPGVASVSIATDNSSNSTKILINTPQGQQIFQINTADINKAASAIHPLTLQGGLVDKDLSGKVVNSGTVNGITVEDGYLVIPVSGAEVDEADSEDQVSSFIDGIEDEDSTGEDTPSVPGRAWMCESEGCNKIFTKLSKLKVHLMRHTGERPFKCSMPDCDWAFTTAYKLKRHEESHQKKKDFNCDFPDCGRRFTTVYNLNTHKKLHERPCTQECPECGLKFPTMRKLDLHMKNHIGAQKTYKCPVEGCNKMFFSPHCMGSHTRVHQEDRDLTCHFEGCGKVYDKLCRLKQHMRTHTGEKPYICNMDSCGWAFSTASKLKRHQRKHTGERRWVCPVESCGKAFMRAEHLKGHLVTHSGERPFVCQVEGCGARFTAKSSMYVHIKKHNEAGKKGQFPCPLDGCIKMFTSKSTLRAHIAKHYQDALAQANTGDLNSIIPILSPEDIQEGLEGLLAAQNDVSDSSQSSILASVNSILPPDAVNIDQSELMHLSDNARLSSEGTVESDLETPVSAANSMVSQLILSSSLAEGQMLAASTNDSHRGSTTPVRLVLKQAQTTQLTTSGSSPISDASTPLFTQELDTTSLLQQLNTGSGSARTDYQSNHMLIDRAKKKRKFLKGSLDSSESGSTVDLSSFQDLGDNSKPSFSTDSLVHTTAGDTFVGSELLSSTSITFRDPETGAIYVQTQLLQDDPPNPELYTDSSSLDVTEQASLTPELPVNIFQDSTEVDEASFTGSTINLQDLA